MLIGAKLRAARKLRSLTLDQVALSAGLTKGFVSRLERDDVSPSVASLVAVCDVLGLRVGELFDPPVTSVSRAGEGRLINFGGEGAVERLVTAGHADRARGHPLRDRAGRQRWRGALRADLRRRVRLRALRHGRGRAAARPGDAEQPATR